jgi:hypothetical protein
MSYPDIDVTPEELDQPSSRFTALGNQIGQLDNEVGSQVGAAKGAAGSSEVSNGLDVLKSGIAGALMVLDSDACLLGTNIGKAKITYQITDKGAYHLTDLTPTS